MYVKNYASLLSVFLIRSHNILQINLNFQNVGSAIVRFFFTFQYCAIIYLFIYLFSEL